MNKLNFKGFLLNENKEYLNSRIGDILNALHDLNQNVEALGTRQLVRNSTTIVNQIRRILHTGWEKSEEPTLKELQKVGIAIAKAIDEKNDLKNVLQSAASHLEKLTSGTPINNLAAPDTKKTDDKNALAPQQDKEEKPTGITPGGPQLSPGSPQPPNWGAGDNKPRQQVGT